MSLDGYLIFIKLIKNSDDFLLKPTTLKVVFRKELTANREVFMSLVPRDSWADFARFFDHSFPTLRPRFDTDTFSPRVDIVEKEQNFEITAELPGVKKEDIRLSCQQGVLSIEASVETKKETEKEGKVVHSERYSGKMSRSFTLGSNIKVDEINAEFTDGVLTVVVPKLDGHTETEHSIPIR
ncbi:Hsp20/alpha crystallin family protein [Vibrio sp. CAU 1672]|uniref:Hsp20/alpha crystallin family protein n=1 Tax=Vibrio sp. CAU 1672 TaxID=3032594 RepID=UPI0023D9CDE1|nr:Hsp20/alpha crystallin family protein [Vibrio sp. CAU 1672]MDF2152697.1 Hsp20/alpha crystallin family protein [Vibrio sp. CAU 1672]